MQPAEVRRLPKGTSAYQAAWILDDADGGNSGDDADAEELEEVVVGSACCLATPGALAARPDP